MNLAPPNPCGTKTGEELTKCVNHLKYNAYVCGYPSHKYHKKTLCASVPGPAPKPAPKPAVAKSSAKFIVVSAISAGSIIALV